MHVALSFLWTSFTLFALFWPGANRARPSFSPLKAADQSMHYSRWSQVFIFLLSYGSAIRVAKLNCHTKQKVFKPERLIEMLLHVQHVATLPRFPFYLVRKGLTVCRKSLYEVQLTDYRHCLHNQEFRIQIPELMLPMPNLSNAPMVLIQRISSSS